MLSGDLQHNPQLLGDGERVWQNTAYSQTHAVWANVQSDALQWQKGAGLQVRRV